MSEFKTKGAKTARSVRTNGHSSSGGHALRQTSSRAYRSRWNNSGDDCPTGGDALNQYQEYPKLVYTDALNPKKYTIVNSVEEETAAVGGGEIINYEAERERLLAVASVKGVQVDKRWGPAKLTKAIEDAGFDPTLDPFK